MYFVISKQEFLDLVNQGKISGRLATYWESLLAKLPSSLRQEAASAEYSLIPHPTLSGEDTRYSRNMAFYIHNASAELKLHLYSLENVIICMEDSV